MADYGFNFLNYHTEYSVTGSVNKSMGVEACFHHVFNSHKINMDNKYNIRIYKGVQLLAQSSDNACLIDLVHIKKHLNILKHIVKFSYKLTEEVNKSLIPYYALTFQYKGSMIEHRFILTWIRYLYEFPHNMYVRDIVQLKQLPEFSKINPFNLLMCLQCCRALGRDIHSYFNYHYIYHFMHYNDIKNKLNEISSSQDILKHQVSYIFPRLRNLQGNPHRNQFSSARCDDDSFYEGDYWENEFEKRLETLKQIYQFIKTYK